MKRFVWRLQRLLDIKIKQEDALRSDLVIVTEKVVGMRGRIMLEKASLRQKLRELASLDASRRIKQQMMFLQFSQIIEDRIAWLRSELKKLEELREKKMAEMMEIRKMRKGLEKLREKAKEEFQQAELKQQQNEIDDRTCISFARKILNERYVSV